MGQANSRWWHAALLLPSSPRCTKHFLWRAAARQVQRAALHAPLHRECLDSMEKA